MNSFNDALSGLAKSAVVVFFGSAVGKALGLLGQILIARFLGPTSFGHVALAYTVVSIVAGLALLGIPEGVTRLISAEKNMKSRHEILRAGYAFALFGGVVVAVGLYIIRFRLGTYLNDDRLPGLLVAFLPFFVAYTISRVSFGALRAYKRSLAGTVARDLGPRIGALLLFSFFVISGEVFFGAVVYWVAMPAIMTLLVGYYLQDELSMGRVISRLPDQKTVRKLWSFSWPLAIGSSFFLLLSNLDILMIGYFMQPRSVGLYRAIQPLRNITTFVITGFAFFFLPVATEYYQDDNVDALNRLYTVSTKWVVAATFPFVLVFTLFASDVVRAFFGSEYVPAAPALAVLTAGLFFRAIVGLNGDMTKAINRPQIELYSVVPAVIINAAFNLIFIPRYGIIGAAIATVIGYAVYNMLELIAIYRAVGSHPFSADSVKPLIPTTLFTIGLTRLTAGLNLSLAVLVAIGASILIVHFFSMVLTRSLGREDLVLLERFENRVGIDLSWIKSLIHSYY